MAKLLWNTFMCFDALVAQSCLLKRVFVLSGWYQRSKRFFVSNKLQQNLLFCRSWIAPTLNPNARSSRHTSIAQDPFERYQFPFHTLRWKFMAVFLSQRWRRTDVVKMIQSLCRWSFNFILSLGIFLRNSHSVYLSASAYGWSMIGREGSEFDLVSLTNFYSTIISKII